MLSQNSNLWSQKNILIKGMSTPVNAAEVWTEIGVYGFISDISGDIDARNTTTDVDVSFSDILENLEMGVMGYVEHRRDKWSFIGDLFYADISVENTIAVSTALSVNLDVNVKQTLAEAFVGYRIFEQDYGGSLLGIDLLGGIRYNNIDVEFGVQAVQLELATAASRNPSKDWADGVIGIRGQYNLNDGWGASAWADIGGGSDSSSYQLCGFANYSFKNNVKIFGGYCHYNIDYAKGSGASRFAINLDYSGPLLGVAYRF